MSDKERARRAEQRRSSSLQDLAERHHVSVRLLYDEINRGRLKIKKVGRRSIVTDEDEEAWLAALASPEAA